MSMTRRNSLTTTAAALAAALCLGAQPAARADEGCGGAVAGHVNMHVFAKYQSMTPPSNLAVTLCGDGSGTAVGGGILTVEADSNFSNFIRNLVITDSEGRPVTIQSHLGLADDAVMTFSVEPSRWADFDTWVDILSDVRPIGRFRANILKEFGPEALDDWEWLFGFPTEPLEIDANNDGTVEVRFGFSGGLD